MKLSWKSRECCVNATEGWNTMWKAMGTEGIIPCIWHNKKGRTLNTNSKAIQSELKILLFF